jgi:hypothetical protein
MEVVMNPKPSSFEDLPSRVSKLEAQSRRWKLATGLLGLVGVPFVLIGAKPADRLEPPVVRARAVEAQEFVLKDESGHIFARLTLNGDKKRQNQLALGKISPAALEFYDENGDVASTVPVTGGFLPVK